MERLFTRLFQRYGMELMLDNGMDCRPVNGVFFSVNSRSWQNMERKYIALGEIPRGQYICILPAYVGVDAGHTVSLQGKNYEVRRAEAVRFGAETMYYWCLCVEKGRADLW